MTIYTQDDKCSQHNNRFSLLQYKVVVQVTLPIPKGNKELYAVMHTIRYTFGGDIVLA